jgi:hypothetical protein
MTFNPLAIFRRDERHEGVRRINIYLLRLLIHRRGTVGVRVRKLHL